MLRKLLEAMVVLVCMTMLSCDGTQGAATTQSEGPRAAGDAATAAEVRLLFIGNSHTSAHRMPKAVEAMLAALDDDTTFHAAMSVGGFLVDHAQSKRTLDLIKAGPWDYVILQAQKYSQSGRYSYPTDGAVKLTELAASAGATVLMYPEWGQAGDTEEAERIHALHETIAAKTGAQVVPIGRAWDRALQQRPDLQLHARDGNHASASGAYLTALVFAAWIADVDLSALGDVAVPNPMDADTRQFLQECAWETVREHKSK